MSTPRFIIVKIPTDEIHDEESFHSVFARALGFMPGYGCNLNAWIDCMSYIDDPDAGMTTVRIAEGGVLVLDLGDCTGLAESRSDLYEAILDCTGSVNQRRIESGETTMIALSFWNNRPVFPAGD